jgi:hypothetical protein
MGKAGDLHLGLAGANRFDQDDLKAGGIQRLYHRGSGRRQAAQGTTRGHRADEHTGVAAEVAHAHAIP